MSNSDDDTLKANFASGHDTVLQLTDSNKLTEPAEQRGVKLHSGLESHCNKRHEEHYIQEFRKGCDYVTM